MLVTKPAPDFTAAAVLPDGRVSEAFALASLRGCYVVLVFYPEDFSYVCPTEILAFDHALREFTARDCAVVGVSVDLPETHVRWRETPVAEGGVGPIRFPLVADPSRAVTRAFGVLGSDDLALRALLLLDRRGVVRHALVNDPALGRSVEEVLRVLDALRFHEEHGDLCPANWSRGRAGVKPTRSGVIDYLSRYARTDP